MDYTDFLVDRAQHMRPLEYDLSDNFNELVRYLHDMGVLDNVPVGALGPADILSASDALAAPLRSLVVGGNSVQDGTPTPDAPVEIQSVENPVLTVAGRNLFDKSDIVPNRYVNASGGLSAWNAASASHLIPVVPNTSYTLHFGASPGNNRIAFYSQAGIDGFISPTVSFSSTTITFTTPEGTRFLRFSCYTTVLDSAQLEAGSTATPYTPYVAPTTVTLPVTLRGLPDGTRDSATYTYLRPSSREGWAWYSREVTRRCYEHSPSRVTNVGTSGTMPITRIYLPTAGVNTSSAYNNLLCNRFAAGNVSQAGHCTVTSAGGVLILSGEMFDTEANANAWLAEHPVAALYPLATPTTETLPEVEMPATFGPSCTIWATADATPQLTAEYVRDLSSTINDMQEAIADI